MIGSEELTACLEFVVVLIQVAGFFIKRKKKRKRKHSSNLSVACQDL